MRQNSISNRVSVMVNQKRTGSLPTGTKSNNPFSNASTKNPNMNKSGNKTQPILNDQNFQFFEDIMKKNKNTPSFCEAHNDPFVSYCMHCKKPMCVKCLLAHVKKYDLHSVKSLHEMQNLLGQNIGSIMDLLKTNVERLEKYRMNLSSNSKLNEMKQHGIDKLEALKDRIFNSINLFFLRMRSLWTKMFDESAEMSMQKDLIVKELNMMIKMFLKAKQNHSQMTEHKSNTMVDFQELKDLLVLSSLLDSKNKIDSKVTAFLKRLDSTMKNKKYPELRINKMVLNEFHDNFKYLFDFSFDEQLSKANQNKNINLKMPDFYKMKNSRDLFSVPSKNSRNYQFGEFLGNANNFIPIIARNRKLMVFDLMQTNFKELMLSEIHSIPHGNQIIICPVQFNRIFIMGGHFFKKASNKVFELDTQTSEFKEHDPMIQGRWLHRVVAYKNLIFVSGGVDNDKELPITSFEIFDVNRNEWRKGAEMLTARHSHSMILFETSTSHLKTAKKLSFLFLIGGIGSNLEYNNQVERFDIEKNVWTIFHIRNPIQLNIVAPFACQINDQQIIIFGGHKYYLNNATIFQGDQLESVSQYFYSS